MDVVEEMMDLAKDSEVSIAYVRRSTNSAVDLLTKEGVGCHSLLIVQHGPGSN